MLFDSANKKMKGVQNLCARDSATHLTHFIGKLLLGYLPILEELELKAGGGCKIE